MLYRSTFPGSSGKLHAHMFFQVIDIKKIGTNNGAYTSTGCFCCTELYATGTSGERYRLVISDTSFFCQAMLATQLNGIVNAKEVQLP